MASFIRRIFRHIERCHFIVPCFFVVMFWSNNSLAQGQQQQVIFSDLHNSSLYRIFQLGDFCSFSDTSYPVNLPDLEKANSQLIFLSIGIPKYGTKGPKQTSIEEILIFFKNFKQHCSKNYPQVQFVQNKEELAEAQHLKKIAVAFALEGSHLLQGKIEYLDSLHQVGLAMVGIAHWFCNDFIINHKNNKAQNFGIAKIDAQSELTQKGKLLIRKLIELDILIDVSHMPNKLFQQVVQINANRTKLIASHANSYKIYKHPRNLTNQQLKAIARTGGLVGVCFHQPIIAAQEANVDALVQHIKHLVSIVGIDHVCLGTDYEGNTKPPIELNSLRKLNLLGTKLFSEGFSEEDINKILGLNSLSIWNGNSKK